VLLHGKMPAEGALIDKEAPFSVRRMHEGEKVEGITSMVYSPGHLPILPELSINHVISVSIRMRLSARMSMFEELHRPLLRVRVFDGGGLSAAHSGCLLSWKVDVRSRSVIKSRGKVGCSLARLLYAPLDRQTAFSKMESADKSS